VCIPLLLLIKFNPVQSLKGKIGNSSGSFIRKSLLSFQFVSALTLTAIVIVAYQQLDFMRLSNKNIKLDHILTVYNPTNYSSAEDSLREEKNELFRNTLLQQASILHLSTSSAIPGEPIGFTYVDLAKRTLNDPDKQIPYKVMYIDYDFIPLFGLELKAGRNYSKASTDKSCLVVSESTVRELGFSTPEEALNKEIYFMEDAWDKWRIIGIVEDYRHESVKTPIHPTIFRLHRNKGQMVYYSMKLNSGSNIQDAVASAETAWKQIWPEKPFNYFFMDQYYDQQFKSEIHFSRIFGTFSSIVVFLACLGIFGLTLFEATSRVKEICIRKVLGSSVANLIGLLSKEYFRLAVISFALAAPLIYYFTNEWLSGFALRITIPAIAFILPLTILLFIVLSISVFQTSKTAKTNPVDHLRSE
jgi:putative ABC transport system permease protein